MGGEQRGLHGSDGQQGKGRGRGKEGMRDDVYTTSPSSPLLSFRIFAAWGCCMRCVCECVHRGVLLLKKRRQNIAFPFFFPQPTLGEEAVKRPAQVADSMVGVRAAAP